jgi:undecaprenyl-diphosphatase
MSRSGSTFSGGLLLGLSREMSIRYSFLLSIPVIAGAGLKKLWDLHKIGIGAGEWWPIVFGFVVASISGYLAISFLLKYLQTNSLNIFIWYRVALAILVVVYFSF